MMTALHLTLWCGKGEGMTQQLLYHACWGKVNKAEVKVDRVYSINLG